MQIADEPKDFLGRCGNVGGTLDVERIRFGRGIDEDGSNHGHGD